MTDPTAIPVELPPLAQSLLHDFAQKALTAAATVLIGYGAISPASAPAFVTLGIGVAGFGASCAWTYIAAWLRRQRLVQAMQSPAVTVATKP